MNFKISIISFLLLLLLAGSSLVAGDQQQPAKHADVDWSLSCMECHAEVTPDAVKDWKSSPHGMMNFGCYMCHGDGQEAFFAKPTTDRCIGCHGEKMVDFSQLPVNNCFDCHQGHTLKFHKNK